MSRQAASFGAKFPPTVPEHSTQHTKAWAESNSDTRDCYIPNMCDRQCMVDTRRLKTLIFRV